MFLKKFRLNLPSHKWFGLILVAFMLKKVATIRGESKLQSNSKAIEDDSRGITRSWWLSVFLVYSLKTYPKAAWLRKSKLQRILRLWLECTGVISLYPFNNIHQKSKNNNIYTKKAKIIKDNTRIQHSNLHRDEVLNKNSLIDDLCIMFKKDNSLFDRHRFIEACE